MENKKKLKVLLLGASLEAGNMGIIALTSGTIKSLKNSFPGADILIFDYAKKPETYNFTANGRQILVPLINIRFSKRFYLANNIALLLLISSLLKLIPSRAVRESIIANNICLKHLYEADLVASLAGGDSFSDIYGLRRFLYMSLPQLLALSMNKRLVLLPQTLGPFETILSRKIAKYIIENADIVYSRDNESLMEVSQLVDFPTVQAKLRFCYDLGFVLDPVKPKRISIEGLEALRLDDAQIVGINVSGLLYMGGYTRDNMFGLKTDYKELIFGIIDHLIMTKKVNVVLIPHVFGGSSENDVGACESVYNALRPAYSGKLLLVKDEYDSAGIKHIIGECDFFIGSRMHSCIAAISQMVPAVAISYSKKFFGVMESIGIDESVADPCKLDKRAIISIIDRAFENRLKTKKLLAAKMPEVRETILGLFEEIMDKGYIR